MSSHAMWIFVRFYPVKDESFVFDITMIFSLIFLVVFSIAFGFNLFNFYYFKFKVTRKTLDIYYLHFNVSGWISKSFRFRSIHI